MRHGWRRCRHCSRSWPARAARAAEVEDATPTLTPIATPAAGRRASAACVSPARPPPSAPRTRPTTTANPTLRQASPCPTTGSPSPSRPSRRALGGCPARGGRRGRRRPPARVGAVLRARAACAGAGARRLAPPSAPWRRPGWGRRLLRAGRRVVEAALRPGRGPAAPARAPPPRPARAATPALLPPASTPTPRALRRPRGRRAGQGALAAARRRVPSPPPRESRSTACRRSRSPQLPWRHSTPQTRPPRGGTGSCRGAAGAPRAEMRFAERAGRRRPTCGGGQAAGWPAGRRGRPGRRRRGRKGRASCFARAAGFQCRAARGRLADTRRSRRRAGGGRRGGGRGTRVARGNADRHSGLAGGRFAAPRWSRRKKSNRMPRRGPRWVGGRRAD